MCEIILRYFQKCDHVTKIQDVDHVKQDADFHNLIKNEIKTSQQCLISSRKHFSNCDYVNCVKQIRYILFIIPEYVEVKPSKFTTAVFVFVDSFFFCFTKRVPTIFVPF